jgi:hypothetical protein
MYGETYGAQDVSNLVYALQQARQSVRWLIKHYPNDNELAAHKAHLRQIESALKGWE